MIAFLINFSLIFLSTLMGGRGEEEYHFGSPVKVGVIMAVWQIVAIFTAWQVFVTQSVCAAAGSVCGIGLGHWCACKRFQKRKKQHELLQSQHNCRRERCS